jgi:putative sterol carrier protein
VVGLLTGPAPTKARKVQFAALKKLVDPGEEDLGKGFARLSEALKASGELADVQFDIVRGRATRRWTLMLEPKAAAAAERASRRPDLRVLIRQETWQRIAAGELSPLDAFLAGELRIRGDTELAKRLLKRAGGAGETDVCC